MTDLHSCTLSDLMEGQIIGEVFYCRHGIPLGQPEPQPQPEPVLKSAWSTLAEPDATHRAGRLPTPHAER